MVINMKKYDGYALVTGGDTGIGYAIAEQLAMNGYNLVLVARNGDELNKAKDHLSLTYKVEVLVFIKDLTEPKSATDVFEFVHKKGIHIALLVNNAGYGSWGLFENSDREIDYKMVELMCRSVVELTYLFLPNMIAKGEGGIIIVSSIASRIHFPNFAIYGACKSFESSFGISLNYELQSKNIDVLVVSPAVVKTHFYERAGSKNDMEANMGHPLAFKYFSLEKVAEQAVNGLGHKIEILNGSFKDKFYFYSTAFMPLKVERLVRRLFYKYVYKITY